MPALPVSARSIGRHVLPLVPALLAGAELAGLVYFLNPDLPMSFAGFARAALAFGAVVAPLLIATHALVARRFALDPARLVPWSVAFVAVAGAIGSSVHASIDAFLLPPEMNRQLIKASLWLAFAAVLVFYTALLHALHRRRYGPKSRVLVALAVIGSVVVLVDRRTSFRPVVAPPPRLAGDAEGDAPRVVLVALPTATLDAVLPLARQGRLPFLGRLLDEGGAARLALVPPPLPDALWASWATGKLPHRHAIVGAHRMTTPFTGRSIELALLPIVPGVAAERLFLARTRPIAASDRRALTLWEIAERLGRPVVVHGTPAALGGTPFPEPGEAVVSSPVERELAALGHAALAGVLARDRQRLAVARRLAADRPEASLSVFALDGFERVSVELFGGFAAARFDGRRAGAALRAAEAYELALGALDDELARLWEELPPPRLLAIASPYGVAPTRGLGRLVRALSTGDPDLRGTIDDAEASGMLILASDEPARRGAIAEARAIDLVPTLLFASGAPIARDFDGRVLTELFATAELERRAMTFVPSFEGLPPVPPR